MQVREVMSGSPKTVTPVNHIAGGGVIDVSLSL